MPARAQATFVIQATSPQPGAIAILQIIGPHAEHILQRIARPLQSNRSNSTSTIDAWPVGTMRLANLANIDAGLAALLVRGGAGNGAARTTIVQLMPHGGSRVVQRLIAAIIAEGATLASSEHIDPRALYPEALDEIEALTLLTLTRAASPFAIDLLLDQPRRWREFIAQPDHRYTPEDIARSRRLDRLIVPALVVVAGRPNVGKSTLSNALMGRAMSIAADLPGTTRDYTIGRMNVSGLVVDWHDTPGVHESDDVIEQRAIAIARRLIDRADLIIMLRDHELDWPELGDAHPTAIFVQNKSDNARDDEHHAGTRADPLRISALTGAGLAHLVQVTAERLVPNADRLSPRPWAFDQRLLEIADAVVR